MMKKIMKHVRLAVLFSDFKRKREWSFILAPLLLSLVFLTNAGAKEPLVMPEGPAVSVDAVEVEVEKYKPEFKPSEDGPALRPNHPPIDQIPPEDMPEEPLEIDKELDSTGPGGVSYRDPVTGETVSVEDSDLNLWTDEIIRVPGYDGADGGSGAMEESDTFGKTVFNDMTMVSVSNRKNHPWRMNVKLIMRFEWPGGGNYWSACSGSMIDSETVLTAGHCVFNRSRGQGWAKEIWVYPGWDGNGGLSNSPPSIINQYGYGRASAHMAAGTNYINSGDVNSDLGLLGIDRAVGMLTNWFGRSWGGSCTEQKGLVYNNASYPQEDCHNGLDMYYWSGHFDSCPGNRLQVDTAGTCLNTVWGGMSGSGAYDIYEGSRYVHAACSTSDRDTFGRYCRQWTNFGNYTDDTFIPDVRGSSFDLQALDVNAGPSTIQAGSKTTLLNHLATNPTNGSASYSTRTFRVYLSSNDNISTADTLLSTQTISRSFAPMQSVRVNMVQVTIPSNTPSGDYFIGVVYDSSTDGNYGNNDTDAWDAVPIKVVRPSVSAEVTSLWPVGTKKQGETARLWARVDNTGSSTLPASARVYYYVDGPSWSGSHYVGSRSVGGLTPGATPMWYNYDWSIPSDRTPGTHNYWARVWDTATGTWLGAWKGPQSFTVVAGGISADVTSLWPVYGDLTPGGEANLWSYVKNTSSLTLPSTSRVWFLVTGPSYSAYVGSASVAGLTSGTSKWYDFIWQIPASAKPGAYEYGARVWDSGIGQWIGDYKYLSFTVKAPTKPSAEVISLWPVPNIGCGGTARLWAKVQNTGSITLPASSRAWYYVRRPDNVVDGYVGSVSVGGLTPGATRWVLSEWKVPYRGEEGIITYTYWARVWDTGLGEWIGNWSDGKNFINLCLE